MATAKATPALCAPARPPRHGEAGRGGQRGTEAHSAARDWTEAPAQHLRVEPGPPGVGWRCSSAWTPRWLKGDVTRVAWHCRCPVPILGAWAIPHSHLDDERPSP